MRAFGGPWKPRVKICLLPRGIGTVIQRAPASAREQRIIVVISPHIGNRTCGNFAVGPRLRSRLADLVGPLVRKNEFLLSCWARTRLSLGQCLEAFGSGRVFRVVGRRTLIGQAHSYTASI